MADKKISQLSAILGVDVNPDDLFVLVDVTDTTMGPSGTDKSITAAELVNALAIVGGSVGVSVDCGPVIDTGTIPVFTTKQPPLPATGIIQPVPPLSGFNFPGVAATIPAGTSGLDSIYQVVIGFDRNYYVVGFFNAWRVTPLGVVTDLGATFASAEWACSGSDGNMYFTDGAGNSFTGSIWKLDLSDDSWTESSDSLDQAIEQICSASDGNMYVCSNGGFAGIYRVEPGTMAVTPIAIPGMGDCFGMWAGSDANLWILDNTNDKLWIVTTAGDVVHEVDLSTVGMTTPWQGCAGLDTNGWIVDNANTGVVARVTPAGVATAFVFPTSGPQAPPSVPVCAAITAGSGGDLWIVDSGNNLYWKLTLTGDFTQFATPEGGGSLFGTCAGPDGGLAISSGAGGTGNIYFFPFQQVMGQVQLTNGPLSTKVTPTTGAYAMLGVEAVILADDAVTLPDPALNYGCQFTIKDNGSGTASILPFGSETIDGAASVVFSDPFEGATLTNDGVNWYVIGQVATSIL